MRALSFSTAYLAVSAVVGYASALYLIAPMGTVAVTNSPGWSEWQLTPNTAASTYSLANFLTSGQVPPPLQHGHQYFRSRDDAGNVLRSDCTFKLKGVVTPARWWSIALLDSSGNALPRPAVLTSDDAVTLGDGTLEVAVSNYPQPGNWLRAEDASNFVLHFTVSGPIAADQPPPLPLLTREDC